jgi:hypothetical protein
MRCARRMKFGLVLKNVPNPDERRALLALCDADDIDSMDKKIGLSQSLQRIEGGQQTAPGI